MRRILLLLPAVLLCFGCESSTRPTGPGPFTGSGPPWAVPDSGPVTLSGIAYDVTAGERVRLSDVRVTLHAWNEDVLVEESVFAEARTDKDGRYSLSYGPRNTVWLGAWKEGYGYHAVRVDQQRGATLDLELVRR